MGRGLKHDSLCRSVHFIKFLTKNGGSIHDFFYIDLDISCNFQQNVCGFGNMTFCTDLDIQCNSQQKTILWKLTQHPPNPKRVGGSIHYFSVQIWIFHAIPTKKILWDLKPHLHPIPWGEDRNKTFCKSGHIMLFPAKMFWKLTYYPTVPQRGMGSIPDFSEQIGTFHKIPSKKVFSFITSTIPP